MAIHLSNNELPEQWVISKLPEFTHVVMGQSPSSETYNYDGIGLPFFQGKAEFGEIHPTINKYCSLPNKVANEGATLLSVRAPVGPTNLANTRCCIGRGLAAIHPMGGMDPKFILLLFRSIELNLSGEGAGSTFSAITKAYVDDLKFAIPPLNEQKRIVAKIEELFSELDNGIAALKTAREQLKVYRQAVLKHAFEGKLTAKWREENANKLESPEQLLARIQQERGARYQQQLEEWEAAVKAWEANGKEGKRPGKPKALNTYSEVPPTEYPYQLPQGWFWQHLGALITGIDQGWSPKCENIPANSASWGVIKTTAVQHGVFNDRENKALPEDLVPREQHELKVGDILVTRAGPRVRVGVCCLVKKVREKLMNCDKVYRIRALENICQPEYLETVLNSPMILDVLESVKSGINDSGVNLNQSAFLDMLIPYCPTNEQSELISKIDESFSVINNQQEAIETAIKQAETLRQSILKKAFSGQLVPQDPNDEPASELLARIQAEKTAQRASAHPKLKATAKKKGKEVKA
ncbi:MAG: restriction endonuclease subunit S [Porticoccaceae bacterium]